MADRSSPDVMSDVYVAKERVERRVLDAIARDPERRQEYIGELWAALERLQDAIVALGEASTRLA